MFQNIKSLTSPLAFILLSVMSLCSIAEDEDGGHLPDFYDEPGYSSGREHVSDFAVDTVDPFSGALSINVVDFVLPGDAGLDIVIRRNYSTHNAVAAQYDNNVLGEYNMFGIGWDIHFGKVWGSRVLQPGFCETGLETLEPNPVLELPNGTKKVFYEPDDSGMAGGRPFITKDLWVAECINEEVVENGITYNWGGLLVTSPAGVRYVYSRRGSPRLDSSGQFNGFVWYVTKIVDQNDNWISFDYADYDEHQFTVLNKIEASDGRLVTFEYTNKTTNALLKKIT